MDLSDRMRPTTPPNDPAELLLYNQYNLAAGSALFGLFGEGFMLCAVLFMWGFWNVKHVKREPWGIQLLAHYQVLAGLASSAYWFHLFLNLFVYSPDQVHTLVHGDFVRTLYIVELYTAMPIEIFYAYRCWELWDRRHWVLACLLLGIGGVIGGAVHALSESGRNYFQILSGPGFWIAIGFLTGTEWCISVTLYLGLRRWRDQTLFHSTRRLVEKLIVAIIVLLKTAIAPHTAVNAVYCFFPKFWTVTFFVILTAKQVIRDEALQQQERNQMNLNIVQDLTELEEAGGCRSSGSRLACSLPFFRSSRNSRKDRDTKREAGQSAPEAISLPTLPAKSETASIPNESKDLGVAGESDFAVHITSAPTSTSLGPTTDSHNDVEARGSNLLYSSHPR